MTTNVPGAWAHLRAALPEGSGLPQSSWNARHRAVLALVAGHALLLPLFGLRQGWGPAYSLGEGALIAALGFLAWLPALPRRTRSAVAALALVVSSAALVQFSGGYIEAHFHYFIVLAIVALYQDWAPFLLAVAYVVLYHVTVGTIEPTWVYNHAQALQQPWRWALVHAVAMLAEGVALLGFWTALEQARARSAVVLDSAGEAMLGLDRDGRVIFANPAAEQTFAHVAPPLLGRLATQLVPGLPTDAVAQAVASRGEASMERPAGVATLEWLLTPTRRSGDTIGAVLTVRDVTGRRRLERMLEARTRQQATVASLGQAAVARRDLDVLLQRAVADVAQTLEVDLCAVLDLDAARGTLTLRAGHGWRKGLVGTATLPADASTQEGATLAAAEPVETTDLGRDTRFKPSRLLAEHHAVAGVAVAVRGPERVWGILQAHSTRARTFSRDDVHFLQAVANLLASALDRHRIEAELAQHRDHLEDLVARRTGELVEANRELEAFSYTVSHDLRSPLRALDGFSRILLQRHGPDLPEDSRRLLAMLSDGAVRMGDLIESVLSLARIGRAEMVDEPLDLSAMAQELLGDLARKQPARKVDWTVEPGLAAHGDPGLVRLALGNLLANAWKFTGRTARPRITVRRVLGEAVPVFCVEDNGAGFDLAHAKELFQPFQRLHEPADFEGTGIGLATVARIVHRHGGVAWADAAPGKGARFFFTLAPGVTPPASVPMATIAAAAIAPASAASAPTRWQAPGPGTRRLTATNLA